MIETRILKNSAHQKPSTVKPGTRVPAKRIKHALITSVKRPNVKRVIGNVRRIRNGLRKTLRIPKTNATTKAVTKLATWIPGRRYAAIIITNALANQLRRILIQI